MPCRMSALVVRAVRKMKGMLAVVGTARAQSARLFEGIAWGGASVMQETRARLAQGNWRWRELPMLWDLDRPEDVLRLRRR